MQEVSALPILNLGMKSKRLQQERLVNATSAIMGSDSAKNSMYGAGASDSRSLGGGPSSAVPTAANALKKLPVHNQKETFIKEINQLNKKALKEMR